MGEATDIKENTYLWWLHVQAQTGKATIMKLKDTLFCHLLYKQLVKIYVLVNQSKNFTIHRPTKF